MDSPNEHVRVSCIQIAKAHAIEAVGVLQQRDELPVLVARRHFLRRAVRGHGRFDGWVVNLRQSGVGKPPLQGRLLAQALRGIRAVTMADAVVYAGDVVQEDRGPQTRTQLTVPSGLDEPFRRTGGPGPVVPSALRGGGAARFFFLFLAMARHDPSQAVVALVARVLVKRSLDLRHRD